MSGERIVLKPFRLSRKEYLAILLRVLVKKRGGLYVLMLILGAVLLGASQGRTAVVLAGLANLLYPLLILLYCVGLTRKRANRSVYEERSMTVDADGLSIAMSGGATSNVPWAYVMEVVELERYVLLYISTSSFIFVERAAFPDTADEARFKQWLQVGRKH
jgi:hypothetical protein